MSRSWLAACFLLACGDDDDGGNKTSDLDCAFFEGANCWSAALDELLVCAPAKTEQGTFSGDRSACTYESGARVTFDDPVPTGSFADHRWNFTLENGGATCLRRTERIENNSLVIELTTSSGTVRAQAGMDVRLTCPDGSRFYSSDPTSISSCYPLVITARTGDVVALQLGRGGNSGESVRAFTCAP